MCWQAVSSTSHPLRCVALFSPYCTAQRYNFGFEISMPLSLSRVHVAKSKLARTHSTTAIQKGKEVLSNVGKVFGVKDVVQVRFGVCRWLCHVHACKCMCVCVCVEMCVCGSGYVLVAMCPVWCVGVSIVVHHKRINHQRVNAIKIETFTPMH